VSGRIFWPDGQPAANVRVDFYPNGYPFGGQQYNPVQVVTGADARYGLQGCGCAALGVTVDIPPSGNGDAQHGGDSCYIMAATTGGQLTTAATGGTVNWRMIDMPCSQNYITPDSLRENIAIMQNDPLSSGGTWQDARRRVEGIGGSSGQQNQSGECAPDAPYNPSCFQ
jgi:hypothetical protein